MKREGILATLILVWVFWIAVPESQDRRAVLREIQNSVAKITECETQQAIAVDRMRNFAEEVRTAHSMQSAEHRAIVEALRFDRPKNSGG